MATAAAAALAVHAAWKLTPFRSHAVAEVIAPTPPPDHYLVMTDFNTMDSLVFLHDLEAVCPRVRAADVLFFGDSRLQFAFRSEELRDFFQEHGLNYYLLGFPYGTDVVALRILERCDARPRLALVFETGFLTGEPKPFDERALDLTGFEARRQRWEFEWTFSARRWLHRWLPHPVGRDLAESVWVLYRSRQDGSWWKASGPDGDIPVDGGGATEIPIPEAHRRAAKNFRDEIERRGGRLILAYVASAQSGRARAFTMARILGVPLLDPPLKKLRSADGMHLLPESAGRYGRTFLRGLEPHLPAPDADVGAGSKTQP